MNLHNRSNVTGRSIGWTRLRYPAGVLHPESARKQWLALLAALLIAATPSISRRRVKSGGIEFSFELPSNFETGRFKPGHVLPDAVVFVESNHLGKHELSSIPTGEVPAIILNVITQEDLAFLRTAIPKIDQYRTRIKAREAWKLPGYPSPYGDDLFYYVVAVGIRDRSVEIIANRYYVDEKYGERGSPTRYDRVIEQIIATLRVERNSL